MFGGVEKTNQRRKDKIKMGGEEEGVLGEQRMGLEKVETREKRKGNV